MNMIRTVLVVAAFALTVLVTGNMARAALPSDSTAAKAEVTTSGSFKIARRCLSIDAIVRKVMRRGFYNIHKVKPKTHTIKMRGYKRGVRYRIKVRRCSGNIIWTEPMP
jgi:hypothetical protein